jgi:bis(5'-nucleosyl)-tetraphosphatase (symmetrical)
VGAGRQNTAMSLYCIGDLQGCAQPFERLLQKIDFSASRDTLILLGDLVNRGPDSLAVLRRIRALEGAALSLLGNHDLHLLAVAQGIRPAGRKDTLNAVLHAPDRDELLDWLRQRPLAISHSGWLMVHAGVLPQWSAAQTMALAGEVEQALRVPDFRHFLADMYGDEPRRWTDSLRGADRLRVIVNALTRLRFCTAEGQMEFTAKSGLDSAPPGFLPWFDVPQRATRGQPILFGHWSALVGEAKPGALPDPAIWHRSQALPMDTGCVWGNCLSATRLGEHAGEFELINEHCDEQRGNLPE